MSRLHPFDHVFDPLVPHFEAIRSEAAASRRDPTDRSQFASLPSVRQLAAGLEDPETVERDPDAADEYVTALWAGYRYWTAGSPTLEADRRALGARLADPRPPEPQVQPSAGYLRLPERWIWAQVAPDAPHEPLDGLFVVPGTGGRDLTVVAVLGLRSDRPGFGQITVHATPTEARTAFDGLRTPPFAPVVDGGHAAGIRSVVTRGELLVLAQLAAEAGGSRGALRGAG